MTDLGKGLQSESAACKRAPSSVVVTSMRSARSLGAHSVIEAVGTQESMLQAIDACRPGGHVGFVAVRPKFGGYLVAASLAWFESAAWPGSASMRLPWALL